jgi:parallel beta-helix repeat protein
MKRLNGQRAALVAGMATVVAILASAGSAGAAVTCNKVASPTGSDSAAGTVQAPYRTATKLIGSMSPGQTGCLRAGTFHSDVDVYTPNLTLTSYPSERATLSGRLYVSDGASGMTVSNLNLDGRSANPASASPTVIGDNVTFDNDDVTNYHTAICFLIGNAAYGRAENVVVENSNIHDCGILPATNHEHGFYLQDSDHVVIKNNWIHDNADYGIQFFPDADGTIVTGNVFDSNGAGVIFSGETVDGVYETSDDNVIQHNVIVNSERRHNVESVYPDGHPVGTGNVVSENCIAGAYDWFAEADGSGIAHPQEGFTATDNLIAQPKFVDAAAGDYHQLPSSPCASILAGAPVDPSQGQLNDPPGATPPAADPPATAQTPYQKAPRKKKKHRKRARSAKALARHS